MRIFENTHIFIVRVWSERHEQKGSKRLWRGWVEHQPPPRPGRKKGPGLKSEDAAERYFLSLEGLMEFVFDRFTRHHLDPVQSEVDWGGDRPAERASAVRELIGRIRGRRAKGDVEGGPAGADE